MQQNTKKLHPLTSLRFFAALMIVIWHSILMTTHPRPEMGILMQGVSFFFVLSGFILTYSYPKLSTKESVYKFWLARLARIWPLHLLMFIVIFLVSLQHWDEFSIKQHLFSSLLNVLLLHSWTFHGKYILSYNSPSWSISVEMFFYLVFPFLLQLFIKNWRVKLISILLFEVLILSILYALYQHNPHIAHIFAYHHPLGRLFEFASGMLLAIFWQQTEKRISINLRWGTLLECIALLLVIGNALLCVLLAVHTHLPVAIKDWIFTSGSTPAFAILIYVMAMQKGYVSKLLSFPSMVMLGEISFAIYLIHLYVMLIFYHHKAAFYFLSSFWYGFTYATLVLTASYLSWRFFETPCRKSILNWYNYRQHSAAIERKLVDC